MGDHARQMRGQGVDAESATPESHKKGNSGDPGAQAPSSGGHALSLRYEPVADLDDGCGAPMKTRRAAVRPIDGGGLSLRTESALVLLTRRRRGCSAGPGNAGTVAGNHRQTSAGPAPHKRYSYAITTTQVLRRSPSHCSLTRLRRETGLKPAVQSAMGRGHRCGACMPLRLETRHCRCDA